jgi:hypothetical protein
MLVVVGQQRPTQHSRTTARPIASRLACRHITGILMYRFFSFILGFPFFLFDIYLNCFGCAGGGQGNHQQQHPRGTLRALRAALPAIEL